MAKRSQSYQMIPIYNYDTGLNFSREPWLIPQKAAVELTNFHVRDGVLRKRRGYEFHSQMVHYYEETVGTGDGNTTNFTHTVSNTKVRSGDTKDYFAVYVDIESGQVVHDEDGDGDLSGDGTGTFDYDTGDLDVTFDSAPADGDTIKIRYNHIPELPITGIYNYYSGTGESQLMVFDTKRAGGYYPLQGKIQDLQEDDIFDSAEWSTYVWFESWAGNSYITNNVDPIKKYDGSSITDLPTDVTGDSTDDISTAMMIFAYKGRLIALRITDQGDIQPQRARWTAAGTDNDWENGGYVDAPTLDWIVSASMFGDRLVVMFERSIWALNYIGDVDMPFTWEKLIDTEGAAATMATTPFAQEIMFLGPVRFLATDTLTTEEIDADIPDFTLGFNQEQYAKTYGAVLEEEHEVFWNYVPAGSETPTMNLVFNYRNSAWSLFDIPGPVVGYSRVQGDFTWDQVDQTWDSLNFIWDAKEIQAGYPTTLIGQQDGRVFILNRHVSDDGADITCRYRTKPINPFIEQGYATRLGYFDIYYSIDPDSEITVKFYEVDSDTPYQETTITLDGPSNFQKHMKRIHVNAVSTSHAVAIEQTDQGVDVDIHAIVFWMKPAAKLIEGFSI